MNRTKIVVRVFTEVPNHQTAFALGESVKTRLSHLGTVGQIDAKEYWKFPEWFEISFVMHPTADEAATFDRILNALGEGWESNQASSDEQWAVWNHETGAFFDSTVRWANVERFPESAQNVG